MKILAEDGYLNHDPSVLKRGIKPSLISFGTKATLYLPQDDKIFLKITVNYITHNRDYILMIMHEFVNRVKEKEELERAISEDSLIIVYGRRRVGKTRLILETTQEHRALYFLCMEESVNETLKRLNRKLIRLLDDDSLLQRPIDSFEVFFEMISSEDIVVVFDEFPILKKNYPRIMGLLQEYFDFKENNTVVLCGSSITMMEDIKSYESPIYGRRSISMKIEPIKFLDARKFLPNYSPEDQVRSYAVLGGVPEYLLKFDDNKEFTENIYNNFFRKTFLHEEAEYLLRYELRDLSTYNTILESIAFGYRSFSDIRSKTEMDSSKISRYLNTLISLGIVKKEVPINLSKKEKIKRKNYLYDIDDNYFKFYYSFVYPFKEEIDLGILERPKKEFKVNFNRYVGLIYEKISRQFLIQQRDDLPVKFTRIGRWWDKEEEIDLIGINDREALLVEVKWSDLTEKDVAGIIHNLERKTGMIKELVGLNTQYLVIGKTVETKGPEIYELSDMSQKY